MYLQNHNLFVSFWRINKDQQAKKMNYYRSYIYIFKSLNSKCFCEVKLVSKYSINYGDYLKVSKISLFLFPLILYPNLIKLCSPDVSQQKTLPKFPEVHTQPLSLNNLLSNHIYSHYFKHMK